VALWTGVLAAPILTLILLQTNYVLSYVSCETRQTWFLHATTAIAVLLAAAAGLWGWRAGRGPLPAAEEQTAPISPETCNARARWMSRAAVASTIWFIVVMLSMSIPVLVLKTCQ
jgi:hypothetical protein